MKKRRFGADKWNGIGGKVESGETNKQAAIRKCQEDISVTPKHIALRGELHFFHLPYEEHYCHIYVAYNRDGKPVETEKMRLEWFNEQDFPYNQMWPSDEFWNPKFLNNIPFKGRVVIENDKVKMCEITEIDSLEK